LREYVLLSMSGYKSVRSSKVLATLLDEVLEEIGIKEEQPNL